MEKCKKFGAKEGRVRMERLASIKTVVMCDGERYATLVDQAGIPLFYPTLYITTQLRNRSLSYSTLVNEAGAINVLLQLFHERGIDIHKRMEEGKLLKEHEIDAMRDRCQQHLLSRGKVRDKQHVSFFSSKQYVEKEVEYTRLTVIHRYLKFLCARIVPNRHDPEVVNGIAAMLEGILVRRPPKKNRNAMSVDFQEKGVDVECLFEILRPGSEFNPWDNSAIQIRNRLAFLLLYELGIRRGELLNLRCDDFDFSANRVKIARRADELIDTRAQQPLVKTNDRLLAVPTKLAAEVVNYITTVRNKTPGARLHPYLLVAHKQGPSLGGPLTIAGYKKLMGVVKHAAPELVEFTGHKLRHHWNERFSVKMDSMDEPPTEAVQEKMRSYAMGWKPGSGSAATYNKRFIQREALRVGMELQETKIRLPKDLPF